MTALGTHIVRNAALDGDPNHGQLGDSSAFHQRLRSATRACHSEVDALYGQFDLFDRASYADFLTAHAMALLPLERWLGESGAANSGPLRSAALLADLTELDQSAPCFEPLGWNPDPAALWGTAYVVEGSRLGGAMLCRSVPLSLPRRYLSAIHERGAWQQFLAELDVRAADEGAMWQERVIAAASRTFDLFVRAAVACGSDRPLGRN